MKSLRRLRKPDGKFINERYLLRNRKFLAYIANSIFNDDHRVIAVSAILDGEYGEYDICTGVPAIITRDGIREIVELNLTEDEESRFAKSNDILRDYMKTIGY